MSSKDDFSSNDETIDHLETLFETESLRDEVLFQDLHKRAQQLGIKINNFLQSIEKNHNKFDSPSDSK